jgi:two-component system, OmpR family, response regulator
VSTLLLVEDDERVRRFVVRGLEAENYAVDVAGSGPQGLTAARAKPYDVLLLDIMLPGYSGRDLCARLRSAGISTPILMLTAMDGIEDKVDGLRSGADDYLTKPFDFDELLARIEALIRRSRGATTDPPALLQVGDIVMDRSALLVRRAGKAIELTAKEFQLLELLMSSPGEVLSRTRILNKVWNHASDPLTNIVDVYIRRLRAKLNGDTDRGPIKTLRGYGYKLEDGDPSDE